MKVIFCVQASSTDHYIISTFENSYLKLAVTVLVRYLTQELVYLVIDVSTPICPSYFKAVARGPFTLMLKPFGVSVWKCYIHLSFLCFHFYKDIVQLLFCHNTNISGNIIYDLQ